MSRLHSEESLLSMVWDTLRMMLGDDDRERCDGSTRGHNEVCFHRFYVTEHRLVLYGDGGLFPHVRHLLWDAVWSSVSTGGYDIMIAQMMNCLAGGMAIFR